MRPTALPLICNSKFAGRPPEGNWVSTGPRQTKHPTLRRTENSTRLADRLAPGVELSLQSTIQSYEVDELATPRRNQLLTASWCRFIAWRSWS